jgi:hypothetical protein
MRASARTMIAIAAAAGLLAGCAKSPAGSANGGNPPKLHLAGGAQAAAGDAAVAPMPAAINGDAVRGAPDIDPGFTGYPGFGGYVLTGTLPTTPTHAPVWRWADATATSDEIVKLGKLVGVTGTPQRHAHGWLLSSASGEVRVSDRGGHPWSFSRTSPLSCSSFSVDIDDAGDAMSASGCAVAVAAPPQPALDGGPAATTPVAPTPPASGPDEAHARAAASALLSGLNITGTEQVDVGAPTSTVTIRQSVGGSTTEGLETTIAVDATGVEGATGRLEQPTKGDDYPLRTAKDAFADLNQRPRMMLMPYCGPAPEPMPMRIPDTPTGKFPLNSAEPGVAPGGASDGAPDATVAPAPPTAVGSPVAPPTAVESVPPPAAIEPTRSCPTPKPIPVTGASLGLQLTYDGSGVGAEILVPSWLFTTEGSTSPLPVIAIDPAYLAGPDESPGAGTTAVEPNSVAPAPPVGATAPTGKDLPSRTK